MNFALKTIRSFFYIFLPTLLHVPLSRQVADLLPGILPLWSDEHHVRLVPHFLLAFLVGPLGEAQLVTGTRSLQ